MDDEDLFYIVGARAKRGTISEYCISVQVGQVQLFPMPCEPWPLDGKSQKRNAFQGHHK